MQAVKGVNLVLAIELISIGFIVLADELMENDSPFFHILHESKLPLL